MRLALAPIVAQLRRAGFKQVDGVLEFSSQSSTPRALPALFVLPTAETARASVNVGGRDQAIDTAFSVILVLDGSRRDQSGVSEELFDQAGRVIDALTGWTHPAASRACDYSAGRILSASGSTVEWAISFTTRQHLRKPT